MHSSLVRLAGQKSPERAQRRLPGLTLGRVLDYLNANLTEPVSLGDLARVAHVSRFHFARLFKQTVGETPHRYIIRRRVERAKELLVEGRLSLSEVASSVGFADQSHLNRQFKRLVGITPKEYREGR